MNWGPNSFFANYRPSAYELEMKYEGKLLSTWRVSHWSIQWGDVVALLYEGKLTLFRVTGCDLENPPYGAYLERYD